MVKFLNSDGLTFLVSLIKSVLNRKQDLIEGITNAEIDAIVNETISNEFFVYKFDIVLADDNP